LDAAYRSNIYNITLNLIKDSPFTGNGLGSFTDVFNAYRNNDSLHHTETLTSHAHNSYLELAMELGIPSASILIIIMVILWFKCLFGVKSRKRGGYIPAIAAASTILVALHALVDFSAQIPAIAIIFTVLIAVGYAQSYSTQVDISDASQDIETNPVYFILSTKLSIILGILILAGGLWQFYTIYTKKNNADILKERAYLDIQIGLSAGVLNPNGITSLKQAENNLEQSIKLAPVDAYSWTYLAYTKLLLDDNKKDIAHFLSTSIMNGYYRKELIFFRLKIIPIIWADADKNEQALFADQIKLAHNLDSKRTTKLMGSSLGKRILKQSLLK
jgi:hypothetical protein